jgi:hypothetical protein
MLQRLEGSRSTCSCSCQIAMSSIGGALLMVQSASGRVALTSLFLVAMAACICPKVLERDAISN